MQKYRDDVLLEIETPYFKSVMISFKRRAKYYIKGKSKIPKKYKNLRYRFNKLGQLYDSETGEKLIANNRSIGKPRNWVVNFQDIWNQTIRFQQRANVTAKLKGMFKPYLEPVGTFKEFPLRFEIFIFSVKMPVDVNNKGVIYTKVIEDLLTDLGKIPDDKAKFINDSGRCKWIAVDNEKDEKMIIRLSKSNFKYE